MKEKDVRKVKQSSGIENEMNRNSAIVSWVVGGVVVLYCRG